MLASQIGHLCLVLCVVIAAFNVSCVVQKNAAELNGFLIQNARVQFILITIAFLALSYGFLTSDFSLKLVYEHSHLDKPLLYKFTALWANHEGSMLLWIWILSLYQFGLSFSQQHITRYVMPFMSLIIVGLGGFVLLTSNPFNYILPIPDNGMGLNPLLQDPGLAYHPPILYLGYVGYSAVAAIVIAGLMQDKYDKAWLSVLKNTSYLAFSFLTLGITLGSFWAYYELGWGGFWFWDPVENVALIPWLFGVILIHLIRLYETHKRGLNGVIISALFAFIFSLIGTFIVRSGVLISIHSFMSDPNRGIILLGLIAFFSLVSFMIYGIKFKAESSSRSGAFFMRGNFIIIQTLIIALIGFVVIFGTLYPIIHEGFYGETISVGAPYFNQMITPIVFVLLALMALMHWLTWQKFNFKHLVMGLVLGGIICGALIFLQLNLLSFFGTALSLWLVGSIGADIIIHKLKWQKSLPYLLAHLGFAIFVLALSLNAQYSRTITVKAMPGEHFQFQQYDVHLKAIEQLKVENYTSYQATIILKSDGQKNVILQPERRIYEPSKTALTETALKISPLKNVYAVLLPVNQNDGEDKWLITLHEQFFIIWIWLGGMMIALAGFASVWIRLLKKRTQ